MQRKFNFTVGSLVAAGTLFAAANTQATVQITELWIGGLPGEESTSDWIELTNFGASAVDPSSWYYDDDSADPTKDDPLVGITSIAPGESVIYLVSWEDDFTTSANAISSFQTAWGAPNGDLSSVQIGYIDGGSGLGGGGDEAWIFDGNTGGAAVIDSEGYSTPTQPLSTFVSDASGNWTPVHAQDGVLGAYQSSVNADDVLNAPGIGSPGVVPEPSSLALLGLGGLLIARRRRG